MSLYADYIKERLGDEIYECEDGFATYRFLNDRQVYLVDIYVTPEKRRLGFAGSIADVVAVKAKEKGCVEMIGTVVPSAKTSTSSLRALLGYGMVLQSSSNDLIVLKKDI